MDENNTRPCNPGSYGYTNGVPAFLMGPHGSYIDMYFTRLTNVRTVFWAMDIVRDKDAFFLADGKNEVYQNANKYHFHRGYAGGEVGCYSASGAAADGYKRGPMYCDGGLVSCMWAERPPYGTHVFDVASPDDLIASAVSADRWCNNRNGGRAISELLILTTPVSGLTRKKIRERIEKKWTRSCGWAGAGDAAWGEGKYRVFNADAAVPAEGTTADGVGFTANAELSGGTLTPGVAGLFASENVEAKISAPIAGKLGVYGPGTIALQQKITTLDEISIGYGATLSLPPGGVVTGTLSIHDKGRLVLDVSNLAEKEHAVIKFGGVSLLMGGTLYDYVSLSGGGDHFFTVSADGTEIHVNSPDVAVTAVWTAAESGDPTDPANWICRNLDNDVLEGLLLPSRATASVTFNADCDLRVLGNVTFADGVTFDLNGHAVKIAGLADQGYPLSSVVNSSGNAGAELHVDVSEGLTITNSTVAISGNVKLVKDGKGTFVAAKVQQTYTGGTDVYGGTFAVSPVQHYVPDRWVLGARGNTTTVHAEGLFRLNSLYGEADGDYKFVLDGGTLEGCGNDLSSGWGQFHSITLTDNSKFILNANTGLRPGGNVRATTLDLGGHTLTVQIAGGKYFFLIDSTIKNGTLDVVSGGWLYMNKNYASATEARDVDIRLGSALELYVPTSVRNYEQVYGADQNRGEAALNVYGIFKPAAGHNYFYGCTMQDGSTIDLSGRTGTWSVKSAFSQGRNTVSFADGASVTLNLAGREDLKEIAKSASPYIVTWAVTDGVAVLPPDSAQFQIDDETRQKSFSVRKDGTGLKLMYSGGFVIYLR